MSHRRFPACAARSLPRLNSAALLAALLLSGCVIDEPCGESGGLGDEVSRREGGIGAATRDCEWGCDWPCSEHAGPAEPAMYPLGSINRAHYHTMQTNAEAADFIIPRNEFVDNSADLTPYGRDHIAEIAARMPTTPFPVLVQRSEHNANPELDALRRAMVVRVLASFGNTDAEQRTVVSQPYGDGINSLEGVADHARFRFSRGLGAFGAGGFGGLGGGLGGLFGGGAGGFVR